MAVRYYTDDCGYRLPQKRLTARWLRGVAAAEGYELGDVSYIFCSARRLLEMNRQYLGHDYYTDVITFDYSDRRGRHVVSGDIFIDVETVRDNARLYGTRPLEEMRRVVVHGVLHLCGQGDKTPRTNAQMHRKEDRYLRFWTTAEDGDGADASPADAASGARKSGSRRSGAAKPRQKGHPGGVLTAERPPMEGEPARPEKPAQKG